MFLISTIVFKGRAKKVLSTTAEKGQPSIDMQVKLLEDSWKDLINKARHWRFDIILLIVRNYYERTVDVRFD